MESFYLFIKFDLVLLTPAPRELQPLPSYVSTVSITNHHTELHVNFRY
jgi:hypothetical protein